MDPSDPGSFSHRIEKLSTGRTYHFVDQKPDGHTSAPTILCVHGFPDIWYGWRHQIGPWVRRGYRVVVPDMLGYGGTDKPAATDEYSTKKLCDDLAALLDTVGVRRAVLVGHDWGSYTVGRFALWHPDRLLALVMLSVPYTPPVKRYIPLEEVVKRVPNYGYQLYFASDNSTEDIESNLLHFVRIMYGLSRPSRSFEVEGNLRQIIIGKDGVPARKANDRLNEQELQYYVSQLKSMNGPLSYYRTSKIRFEEEQAGNLPDSMRADLPVLYFWGTKDRTTTPEQMQRSRALIPRLQDIALENVGHWVMVEARYEVTDRVMEWLDKLLLTEKFKSHL